MQADKDRIFVLLSDDNKEIRIIKDILENMLDLASKTIKYLFEERFDELKNKLDEIMQFTTGIKRVDNLPIYYLPASYYSYMLAYQKFFFNSYKVRQGIILDKMLQNILKEYRTYNITNSLHEWLIDENYDVLHSISTIVRIVENWDDLWVSYAVASLELENFNLSNMSNVRVLNEEYKEIGADFNYSSYVELTQSIDDIFKCLIPKWNENSIPFRTPSDQAHYIKDLLFLKACYEEIS